MKKMQLKKTGRRMTLLLLSVLLILVPLFCLVGCGEEEGVPKDMQSVTCAGANFRLYVPKNWTPKTGSGVSGAFITLTRLSDVSAYQKTVAEGTDAESFWQDCLSDYRSKWPDLTMLLQEECTMGKIPARADVFTMTAEDRHLQCMQVSAVSGTTAYVFFYTAEADLYETYLDQVQEIVSQIEINMPPASGMQFTPAVPENLPDGMICISGEHVGYRFFIPETWTPGADTELTSAKAPGDDSNVNMTVYLDEALSDADAYLAQAMAAYRAAGYTVQTESVENVTMGGVDGKAFLLSFTVGSEVYRVRICVVIREDLVFGPTAYVLTYTSTPELYESHLNEVLQMQNALTFR